jgi:hypothetical protein
MGVVCPARSLSLIVGSNFRRPCLRLAAKPIVGEATPLLQELVEEDLQVSLQQGEDTFRCRNKVGNVESSYHIITKS